MPHYPRLSEYKILAFRIALAYLFYFVVRVLFYAYNQHILEVNSVREFLKLCYYGLAFDTTTILYINGLFILFSILPFKINTTKGYQKFLFYVYFSTNLLAYATNFIDFIYYRYIFGRTTVAILDSLEHESNKTALFTNFVFKYWHVFLLFFTLSLAWIWLYKRIKTKPIKETYNFRYYTFSILSFLVITTVVIGGIRGDFKKSTRPLNMLDANRHTTNTTQADIILNTPFAIIRTFGSNSFKKINEVSQTQIDSTFQPIKHYQNNPKTKPNIVIFIIESLAREYVGSFNNPTTIKNYKGYTPFIDSLAQHSLIFTNAYANGYKSIHGMSSVIAGIPSFRDAFTSSPYAKQKIESLVSTLKSEGYDTSFFHGAPNGSMGFLGFGNILGYDHYYGKTEFNNDAEFDGFWGIWDEPFFEFMGKTLNQKKQPFMATMFSVSSHEPYIVPEKYKNKFPKGDVNIHQPVGYTDYSLKQFFKKIENQPWAQNTIFIITGDHCNTIFYDEYTHEMMRNAVPILFYSPNKKYVGKSTELAQHIDIYPTILDMIGYEKPFRSWGRSLVAKQTIEPYIIRYSNNHYQYIKDNFVLVFDGKKTVGLYTFDDKALKNNILEQNKTKTQELETQCKAFVQDYMNRIIDKKL